MLEIPDFFGRLAARARRRFSRTRAKLIDRCAARRRRCRNRFASCLGLILSTLKLTFVEFKVESEKFKINTAETKIKLCVANNTNKADYFQRLVLRYELCGKAE